VFLPSRILEAVTEVIPIYTHNIRKHSWAGKGNSLSVIGRLRQEDCKFKATVGYTAS
jgi:hypothetical protein